MPYIGTPLTKLRILFFGTPQFGVPVLRVLHAAGASLLCVTNPDAAVGRTKVLTAPPIKQEAERLSLVVVQPQRIDGQLIEELQMFHPDVAVLAAYGKIIPPTLLALPKRGFVNVHPSLLPKYRGASPVAAAILAGERETGVAIMQMDERLDHGPVLAQRSLPLDGSETSGTLTESLAVIGSSLLVEVLPRYLDGTLRPTPQDDGKATMTRIIKKEEARIDWNDSAALIERQIRAYSPWPVAWTILQGKAVQMHKAQIGSLHKAGNPGQVTAEEGRLIAFCGGKSAIELLELQQEGKRKMTAKEFLNGNLHLLPATFG